MQVGILIIVLFLVLLLLRVPAAFCMLITTLVYALVEQSLSLIHI